MSIFSKVSEFVRSLTSNKANEDTSPGVEAPPPEDGAVEMDRAPQSGFEPERES